MLNAIVKDRPDDYVPCFARKSTPTAENKNIFCDHFSRSVSVSALGRRNNSVCTLFRAWSLGRERGRWGQPGASGSSSFKPE